MHLSMPHRNTTEKKKKCLQHDKNIAHYPVSTCFNYSERKRFEFLKKISDIRRGQRGFFDCKTLAGWKDVLHRSASPNITVNTAHLKMGHYHRSWFLFFLLHHFNKPESQQLCVEVGAMLCLISESDCSEKIIIKTSSCFPHLSFCLHV